MYVLQCDLATKKRGVPVYLDCMTAIGPKYTENLDEAERFESKESAMQSPAYTFMMCFFEPVEVE